MGLLGAQAAMKLKIELVLFHVWNTSCGPFRDDVIAVYLQRERHTVAAHPVATLQS